MPSLPDLDLIASQTRLIIRHSRRFSASGFLQSLLSSVVTGSIVSHSLQAATEQDKTIGKEFIIEIRRGDFALRDMGSYMICWPCG